MTRIMFYRFLSITTLLATLSWAVPMSAQLQFRQILQNTPKSKLQFAPYTVGSVISGGGNRLYTVTAKKNQYLKVQVNSTGARAFVAVFDSNGKELATLTDQSKPFEYTLPRSGNYYIFCYSGPTVHLYDLIVRVD